MTLIALIITFAKIKAVEMIEDPVDPNKPTFKPQPQQTATGLKYTGNGFLPEDWYFFHSEVWRENYVKINIFIF